MNRLLFRVYLFTAMAVQVTIFGPCARADDKLLDETVEFTGTVLYLAESCPCACHRRFARRQTAVFGFGEASDGQARRPIDIQRLALGS